MAKARRSFGRLRKLPSGRWQASYTGPDSSLNRAPHTFDTREDAEGWLTDVRREISRGEWSRTAAIKAGPAKATTFGEYAAAWLTDRPLKPRTRAHYASLLAKQLDPTFGSTPLGAITPHTVRQWHTGLGATTPTLRAHAYGLLRTILGDAVHDGALSANPAHIRGAGTTKRVHQIKPATLAELDALVGALPTKLRPMALLAAWCGLRFGELTELRRKDVDLQNGVLHVRRGVVRAAGKVVIGTPKSAAGARDVTVPPHIMPALREHLSSTITGGQNGLLFPAADGVSNLAPSTLYGDYYKAREAAGRPDLRFHDLRHTGATMAAGAGASLAENMARLGHSTAGAAMRYQHAAQGRDKVIAAALSAMATEQTMPGSAQQR